MFNVIKPLNEAHFSSLSFSPNKTAMNCFWGGKVCYDLLQGTVCFVKEMSYPMKDVFEIFRRALGLCGSCASAIHWAHESRLISVGKYARLFHIGELSCSLIYYTLYMVSRLSEIAAIKRLIFEISKTGWDDKKERIASHKEDLCLNLLALIGAVGTAALRVLNLNALFGGAPVSGSYTYPRLAGFSCAFSLVAYPLL